MAERSPLKNPEDPNIYRVHVKGSTPQQPEDKSLPTCNDFLKKPAPTPISKPNVRTWPGSASKYYALCLYQDNLDELRIIAEANNMSLPNVIRHAINEIIAKHLGGQENE